MGQAGGISCNQLLEFLDGGDQGFVATCDDTLQLGISLLDDRFQIIGLLLEILRGLVVSAGSAPACRGPWLPRS